MRETVQRRVVFVVVKAVRASRLLNSCVSGFRAHHIYFRVGSLRAGGRRVADTRYDTIRRPSFPFFSLVLVRWFSVVDADRSPPSTKHTQRTLRCLFIGQLVGALDANEENTHTWCTRVNIHARHKPSGAGPPWGDRGP